MNNRFIKISDLKRVPFLELDKENVKYTYYKKDKEKLKNQYTIQDILTIIESSHLTEDYTNLMQNFNTSILYKSDGHGINHNVRVCFFAYIISIKEKVFHEDFKLIMEACKYHDIGRQNDIEDESHGKRSSEKLTFLESGYSKEELNYIKTIVTCHSLEDIEFEPLAVQNHIQDIDRCKKKCMKY